MSKKGTLWILLIIFVLADISIASNLFSNVSAVAGLQESGTDSQMSVMDTDRRQAAGQDIGQSEEVQDYPGTCYNDESFADSDYDENLSLSGTVIDIIGDELPCISGYANEIYSDEEALYSNYGDEFTYLVYGREDKEYEGVSFYLDKQFSELNFDMGLWEDSNTDSCLLQIFRGAGEDRTLELEATIGPNEKTKNFTLDVSDWDSITIRNMTLNEMYGYFVTNGFKITYK